MDLLKIDITTLGSCQFSLCQIQALVDSECAQFGLEVIKKIFSLSL